VLVIDEGNGARQILGLNPGAVRAVIVGVVDEVALSEAGAPGGEPYSVSL
jgi:microcompartment protein CcmK/EutM